MSKYRTGETLHLRAFKAFKGTYDLSSVPGCNLIAFPPRRFSCGHRISGVQWHSVTTVTRKVGGMFGRLSGAARPSKCC
jgi:hypothetical protein